MESVRLRGAAEREGHFVFGVVRSMVKLGWRAEGGREGRDCAAVGGGWTPSLGCDTDKPDGGTSEGRFALF